MGYGGLPVGDGDTDSIEIVRAAEHEPGVEAKPSPQVPAQQSGPARAPSQGADRLTEFRALQQRAAELIAQTQVAAPGQTAGSVVSRLVLALLALAACAAVVVLAH